MAQKSKFGGALAIGKQAIGKETAPQESPPSSEAILQERGSANAAPTAPPPAPVEPEPEPSLYTDKELKQVNAGGLKVAFAVRRLWMLQAHLKGVSLASIIKPALIEELGLPEGFSADNLSAPSEK